MVDMMQKFSIFFGWPWTWIFKVKYLIGSFSRENGLISTKWKKKKPYQLDTRPKMLPSILTLDMTLTLNFQCEIFN